MGDVSWRNRVGLSDVLISLYSYDVTAEYPVTPGVFDQLHLHSPLYYFHCFNRSLKILPGIG